MRKAIGYLSYTHGLDGKIKVVPMVSPTDFRKYLLHNSIYFETRPSEPIRINIFAFTGKIFICRIDGIDNVALAKKNTKQEIIADINTQEEYINPTDLLHYEVFLTTDNSQKYGTIVNYGNYGSGNVIEVFTLNKKREYYLCTNEYIINVDTKNKSIILHKKDII